MLSSPISIRTHADRLLIFALRATTHRYTILKRRREEGALVVRDRDLLLDHGHRAEPRRLPQVLDCIHQVAALREVLGRRQLLHLISRCGVLFG